MSGMKCVHLQTCPAVKENLAQVGDTLGCRATPPAPVETGYIRKTAESVLSKSYCQHRGLQCSHAEGQVETARARWNSRKEEN